MRTRAILLSAAIVVSVAACPAVCKSQVYYSAAPYTVYYSPTPSTVYYSATPTTAYYAPNYTAYSPVVSEACSCGHVTYYTAGSVQYASAPSATSSVVRYEAYRPQLPSDRAQQLRPTWATPRGIPVTNYDGGTTAASYSLFKLEDGLYAADQNGQVYFFDRNTNRWSLVGEAIPR